MKKLFQLLIRVSASVLAVMIVWSFIFAAVSLWTSRIIEVENDIVVNASKFDWESFGSTTLGRSRSLGISSEIIWTRRFLRPSITYFYWDGELESLVIVGFFARIEIDDQAILVEYRLQAQDLLVQTRQRFSDIMPQSLRPI